MKKNKKAFTLIEIIIATWILVVSVFWVYKLIWENIKLINNSENYNQTTNIFPSMIECIENLWFTWFYTSWINDHYFSYWSNNNECLTWSLWTWSTIDNIFYEMQWNITNSWSEFIDWYLIIKSESSWNQSIEYKQIKK